MLVVTRERMVAAVPRRKLGSSLGQWRRPIRTQRRRRLRLELMRMLGRRRRREGLAARE